MNQPKFKFGDRVRGLDKDNSAWIVKGFYKLNDREEWLYIRGESYLAYKESEIELYQEPQKKKLYAYQKDDFVVFGVNEKTTNPLKFLGANFERAPEYDIEYPEGSK